ncbi:hypothetical protein PFICI_00565 [Pestalotiopsis fici W106-1]|uniref:Fungal N-terminal domain-containing protein n=1 Tax=Pestalotiopsis fici (strain W106-1 / CGMCC3.15140) TaxID=1229662 RepID=W3XML6_PESFW|nr:uncharacterized protein PFICI_00565 [Pestalotiopsis fici W106-1]ETS86737.1 hypothetical protein PFICI_00565 [Pestalotiopsis fici W106-1]
MADGLSIAASVAGLVSLGFQVCSGITKYLDGIKSRAEELDSARKYEQTLKTSIQALENILPQLVAHNQHSSTAVIACIQLCKDELEALRRLVAELCDETRNNPNLLDRAKASKKRLTYAFNRSRLTNLQARVDQASKSLQVTLQILGLESSISQGQTLRTIESTSNDAVAEIIETKVEVTALANDVSHIRNEATLLRAAIESIGLSLLDLGQTAIRSEQGIRVIREDATRANRLLATQSSRIGDQVDAIQIQNALNHGATTKLLQLTQLDKASARPIFELFNQMISRPSYLEEVSEEYLDVGSPARDIWNVDDQPQTSVLTTTARDRQSSTSMLQFRSSRECTCHPRHRLQRKQAVWSGFIFYQDNSWSENHFPTCDLWQQPKTTEQKWGMRQVGLGWLAHKAIELTFSCKFGAGGASFGPNFTYYPTVDEDAAPAFQIIQILKKASRDSNDRRQFILSTWKGFFERALTKLETLFRKGQASPNDVNSRNQTLIYPITSLVWDLLLRKWRSNDSVRFERLVLDFLENVTYLDIPSNIYDTNGESPMKTLTASFKIDSAKSVEILFGKAADIPAMMIFQENSSRHMSMNDYLFRSISLQRVSQLIAEACGCGPLCQAVLIGDGKQVKRLLETDPRSIMEVNGWGQTPLHLSASQPDMLRLLLPALGPSQLNKPDFSG